MQGSLFPEQFQNPERSYNEIRAKFTEFTPVKFNHFILRFKQDLITDIGRERLKY